MLSRRHFCCAGALASTAATLGKAFAADQCAAPTQLRQAAMSPADARKELKIVAAMHDVASGRITFVG